MWSSYEKLKSRFVDNLPKIKVALLLVLMFFVGFGAGKFERTNPDRYEDYNTKTSPAKVEFEPTTAKKADPEPRADVLTATTSDGLTCVVKGNISSSKEKIYHIQGGMFYERTKAEECFASEDEARSAGYRKSSR